MPFNRETQVLLQSSKGDLYNIYLSKNKTLDYKIKKTGEDWGYGTPIIKDGTSNYDADISKSDYIYVISSSAAGSVALNIYDGTKWVNHTLFSYDPKKRKIKDLKIKIVNSKVHVFYYAQEVTNNGIWAVFHHYNDGNTWHNRSVGLTASRPTMSSLCVGDYKGKIYLSYTDIIEKQEQIIYYSFDENKITWSPPILVTNSPGHKLYLSLITTSHGLHFCYSNFVNNSIDIKYCGVFQEKLIAVTKEDVPSKVSGFSKGLLNKIKSAFSSSDSDTQDEDHHEENDEELLEDGPLSYSEVTVSKSSNGNLPMLLFEADKLICGWIETGRLYTSVSQDFGMTWEPSEEYEPISQNQFLRYFFRLNNVQRGLRVDAAFGTYTPNLMLVGISLEDTSIEYKPQETIEDKEGTDLFYQKAVNKEHPGQVQNNQTAPANRPKSPLHAQLESFNKNKKIMMGGNQNTNTDSDTTSSDTDNTNDQSSNLNSASNALIGQYNELKKQLDKSNIKLAELTQSLAHKESQIIAKDLAIEKLNKEFSMLKKNNTEVREDDVLKSTVQSLSNELKEKERTFTTLISALETLTGKLNQAELRNEEIIKEIHRLKAENDFLKNENTRLVTPYSKNKK
jgi:hypothetical protein